MHNSGCIVLNDLMKINNHLCRLWREAVKPNLRYYPPICLKGLRKTIQNMRQCHSQNSNQVHPKTTHKHYC